MRAIFTLLFWACQAWVICAIGRALLSWFPLAYESPWWRLNRLLVRVTEPLLKPVRRLVNPVAVGGVGIDVAFLIVIFFIELVAIPFFGRHAY